MFGFWSRNDASFEDNIFSQEEKFCQFSPSKDMLILEKSS